MKKKILQEHKEKAIIESFAKTFNKIKRLDENYMDETYNEGKKEYFAAERNKDLTLPVNNEYIYSLENNKPIFIYQVNDKGHKEPVPVTKDILIDIHRDYRENYPGSPSDFARERGIPVEYIGKILMAGRYFSPDYGTTKNDEIDEISIPKILAPVAFAAGMMGAPKDASAQTLVPKGIERTAAKEMPTQMPSDPLMAGKTILMSYRMNPFTADMWSKRSRENLKMFKLVKKMVDYEGNGGTIQDEDRIALGNAYKDSQVGQDFLLRKKDDMTTARLEEDGEQMESEDNMISSKKLLMFMDILEKNVNNSLSEYKSKSEDKPALQFMVHNFQGYKSAIEIIKNQVIDIVNKKWG